MTLTPLIRSRRQVLPLLFLGICVLVGCPQKPPGQGEDPAKPNILYILTDDLGWMDTNVYGSRFYETPNIDRLAQTGMRFTHGYAAAANCAPSRACLMTGLNTPRHGIYTVANSDRGDPRTRKLVPISNTTTLTDTLPTLAKMLRGQGYATGSFGKWHLSDDPLDYGFDVNVAGNHRGDPGDEGYFAPYSVPGLSNAPIGENLTDRLTQEAMDFMKAHKGGPFLAYLSFYAVHTPLETTKALLEKYRDKQGDSLQHNAVYAGMVETVDRNVGRLLDFLESEKLLGNTLIVFTSDNGGIRSISRQDPLRAGKGSYYEGGIRVPFIFSWQGHIAPGTESAVPITNMDIFPTLIAYSGVDRQRYFLDGVSLEPLLGGKGNLPQRDLFFHFPIYLQAYDPKEDDGRDPLFRTRPGSVIISGNWKLHHYFEDGGLELYNLREDLGERHNLAGIEPEIARNLFNKLDAWRRQVKAPTPREPNPEYQE